MIKTERDQAAHPLVAFITQELARPVNQDLHTLKQALLEQLGSAVTAMLFYGSCLRTSKTDEGLVDLYILVDHYRDIHPSIIGQWANACLPPTVFFFRTTTTDGRDLRAKCAILSLADFDKGAYTWFQSYLWARFAQPSRLVFSRTPTARMRIELAVCAATQRLITETLALQAATFSNDEFWTRALTLTYGTELRPENSGRPALITQQNQHYFADLLAASAQAHGAAFTLAPDGQVFINHSTEPQRRRQERRWRIRRVQGRVLNVLRLLKSLFTVRGGVDYAIWKLERHWGEPIKGADRLRRYPLIFCWPLLWRLLKQRRSA